MKDGKVLVSKVAVSPDLKQSVETAIDLIGGLKRVVSDGDRVFVKPNFNSDDPFPASSDPEFVKAVVRLLYDAGASEVTIIESSGMPWLPTRNVLEKTGMLQAARECGAKVTALDHGEWVEVAIEGKRWKKISLAKEALDDEAKFVWLPCMKTHRSALFSLSLKLVVGLLDFRLRGDMHSSYLEEKIAEINLAVHPDLIVMDGRKCFVTGGPDVGRVESPNVILASGDRVAIDVEAIKTIQAFPNSSLQDDPWSYLQIRRAVELGLGVSNELLYEVHFRGG
jgi:uncharacterized protein (DUF362 family)